MFGPHASPVVQAQRTWHIGPTTCVFTSRSFARFESDGSSSAARNARRSSTDASSHLARVSASSVSLQIKHDALVILSLTTYVRKPPEVAAAFMPRDIEAERPPSVCASGTSSSSCARPVSRSVPSGSSSSYRRRARRGAGRRRRRESRRRRCATPVRASRPRRRARAARRRRRRGSRRGGRRSTPGRSCEASASPELILASVTATLMDGKALAARIRAEVAREVAEFGGRSASRPCSSATIPPPTSTSG